MPRNAQRMKAYRAGEVVLDKWIHPLDKKEMLEAGLAIIYIKEQTEPETITPSVVEPSIDTVDKEPVPFEFYDDNFLDKFDNWLSTLSLSDLKDLCVQLKVPDYNTSKNTKAIIRDLLMKYASDETTDRSKLEGFLNE